MALFQMILRLGDTRAIEKTIWHTSPEVSPDGSVGVPVRKRLIGQLFALTSIEQV